MIIPNNELIWEKSAIMVIVFSVVEGSEV